MRGKRRFEPEYDEYEPRPKDRNYLIEKARTDKYWSDIVEGQNLKYFDYNQGSFSNLAFTFQADGSVTGGIWKRCWDISSIPRGLDETNRIGDEVVVKRVSVRFIIWYNQTSVIARYDGSGRSQGAFRCFCYCDKVRRFDTDPPFGWPGAGYDLGTNTTSAFSFNKATGFLEADKMSTFYNLANIKNYEILGDSGVTFMNPAKKARKQIMHAVVDGVPEPGLTVLNTGYPGGYSTLSAVVSDNDFEADEVNTRINVSATLDGAVELAAGTGGPFESIFTTFFSTASTPQVRIGTTIQDQFNSTATQDQLNRIEIWNPSAEPEIIEWNFDVDIRVRFQGNTTAALS